MATGPRYQVPFRRRRKGKTNYHKRLGLIISKKPRLIVRKTGKNLVMQLAISNERGDLVTISATALELAKYGYMGFTGNIPSAYLTGLLFGKKAVAAGYDEAVLDIGLNANSKGARIYAALYGALDAGLDVPHNEQILPSEERLHGEHIAHFASQHPERFSKSKISLEELPQHVDTVKANILEIKKG